MMREKISLQIMKNPSQKTLGVLQTRACIHMRCSSKSKYFCFTCSVFFYRVVEATETPGGTSTYRIKTRMRVPDCLHHHQETAVFRLF